MKKYYLRKLSVLLMVIFIAMIITSCGKKENTDVSAFIGEWKLLIMEDKEQGTFTAEDIELLGLGEAIFHINEDGSAVFAMGEEKIDSTWKLKDKNTIIFDGGEEGESTGVLENDKLIFGDDEIRMEFQKNSK